MKGITKKFPGVIANYRIDFDLKCGEVHALLGENGAGKTTLVSILYGVHQPDEGEIYVYGKKVRFKSPKDAIAMGIGMVHQYPKLIDSLTVAENIALGLRQASVINPLPKVEELIKEYSEKYGLKVNPKAKVWQLSAGEKQRVEILRVLMYGAKILILDEPTTSLSPLEREDLFEAIKNLAQEGASIIFITHKLNEVMKVSDRITVLRRGRKIGTIPTSEADPHLLIKMMLGEEKVPQMISEWSLSRMRKHCEDPGNNIALEVEDLYVLGDRGELAVQGVSFIVRRGEIFGIAGIAGNGQRELVEAIVGLRRALKGRIRLMGVDVTNRGSRTIAEMGVAYIPEDRVRYGLVLDLSVADNLILRNYRRNPFSGRIMLNRSYISHWCEELVKKYEIKTPSINVRVRCLSGGNMQRVVLARELSQSPRLIVAFHPTMGLDVAATEQVRKLLLAEKERGAAILLVSEDLDEVMELSDRIGVMYDGRLMGVMKNEEVDVKRISLLMMGVRESEVDKDKARKGV
ncbi:MAG: heme ABC transporter ATP-binding protein [Thermoprotei archaeon]|nr:MAG: heme ABC transporter ATP-binding protein [Thermoprotei archaeon]RLF22874.1 MAG: heme ABC transporter ATP-binding protein [Thermoprotei archaeon]